jgi:hypothetical protein
VAEEQIDGRTVETTTGEVIEPDEPETGDELEPDGSEGETLEDGEPDEDDAETEAAAERAKELAAEQQEEAQSIEAQQRDQDAKRKKLDQLAGHVAKRYGEILGADLDGFVGCPLCASWYPGIRLPVMPDYDTVAAVKVAIGEDPDPPLSADQFSRQCEVCGGQGKVLTGSNVQGQKSAQCLECDGRGWVPTDDRRRPGHLTAASPIPAAGSAPVPVPNGDEPAEVQALKALGYIVVPPMTSPEMIAAQ